MPRGTGARRYDSAMSVDIRFAIRSPHGHPAGSALYDVEVTDEVAVWIESGVAFVIGESVEGDGSGGALPPIEADPNYVADPSAVDLDPL